MSNGAIFNSSFAKHGDKRCYVIFHHTQNLVKQLQLQLDIYAGTLGGCNITDDCTKANGCSNIPVGTRRWNI